MSTQIWKVVPAQELQAGDLIRGMQNIDVAVQIAKVEKSNTVIRVFVYTTPYLEEYPELQNQYLMYRDQPIPVAKDGIRHWDKITNFTVGSD